MTIRTALVPAIPDEEAWSGLARDIVMWWGMDRPTGKNLYLHLDMLGRDVPAWLREEIRDIDHVPAKGDVAVAIHRAIIAASPRAGRVGLDVLERAAEAAWEKFREQVADIAPIEPWADITPGAKQRWIDRQRAAFEAAGLAVEEAAS